VSQAERRESQRIAEALKASASELESAHEKTARVAASVTELQSQLALKQAANDSLQDQLHAAAVLHAAECATEKERSAEEQQRRQQHFEETLRQARDAWQAEAATKEQELAQTTALVTRLQADLKTAGTVDAIFSMDETRCALWCAPRSRARPITGVCKIQYASETSTRCAVRSRETLQDPHTLISCQHSFCKYVVARRPFLSNLRVAHSPGLIRPGRSPEP
jgi:hypothetical protein